MTTFNDAIIRSQFELAASRRAAARLDLREEW
jgi:hypothetical protein